MCRCWVIFRPVSVQSVLCEYTTGTGRVCLAYLLVETVQASTLIGEITQDQFWNIVVAFGGLCSDVLVGSYILGSHLATLRILEQTTTRTPQR